MESGAHDHEHDVEEPAAVVEPLAGPQAPSPLLAGGSRAFGTFVARMGSGILPGGTVHPSVAEAIGQARGSGHSVPADVRAKVEPKVGDDFSDVRLHTDAQADSLARSVSARAFTTGSDVFFAAGEYQPSSSSGQELLAHELTHVTQQRGAPTTGPMTVSQPGDAVEVEAESVAGDLHG